MIRYLLYLLKMVRCAALGSRTYYLWLGFLLLFVAMGGVSWAHDLREGLIVTNMTDHVSWGIGIANFVYFVGVAAGAAVLVVPAYAYVRHDIKEVVLLGELLAVAAITTCLLFIVTDVGRPERLWHLIPGPGILNLPSSLLSWDVVVFNGYLALNLYIPGYLLFKRYMGQKARPIAYMPFVFISMVWALSIHTVTAFLLSGLGSRPFWNTPILAPRFLISAGASGPAILAIILQVVRRNTKLQVQDSVFEYFKYVLRITMPINLFLVGCECFGEFYTGTQHADSAHYLYFGLHGHNVLPKYIWTAIFLNVASTAIFSRPSSASATRSFTRPAWPPSLACGLRRAWGSFSRALHRIRSARSSNTPPTRARYFSTSEWWHSAPCSSPLWRRSPLPFKPESFAMRRFRLTRQHEVEPL